MKRIVSIALAAIMAFCMCACKSTNADNNSSAPIGSESQAAKGSKITLLYTFGDSFNPYSAATELNRKLGSLLYEPLVRVDNEFVCHNALAESVTLEGTVCTVKLRDSNFTEGTPVRAEDVIHSFNLAKNSSTAFASYFGGVSSVTGSGTTVVFNLSYHNPNFKNLLTFPILKAGSEGGHDIDGVEIPPIGSGRYYLDSENRKLVQNERYYGKKGAIKEINLINAPDSDSVSHYVEVGACDLYFTDISDGNIVRMSGKRTEVNLNHLVYIGINSSYGTLQTKEMRYAISAAIDREAICKGAYYNNSTPATGYFNPSFADTAPVQTLDKRQNLQITVENLGKIGYNSLDGDKYYANSSKKHPQFTLLVNSENRSRVLAARLIAEQCAEAGIEINVIERSYGEYASLLASNNFQLYLGEVKILPDMDMAQLVTRGGSAAFGVGLEPVENTEQNVGEGEQNAQVTAPTATVAENMISGYRGGQVSIADLAGALVTELPQIPVCYRNGMLFYSSDLGGEVTASADDIYYTIADYTFEN